MGILKPRTIHGRPGYLARRVLAGAVIGFLCIIGPADGSAAKGDPVSGTSIDLTEMSLESRRNVSVYSASKYEQKATGGTFLGERRNGRGDQEVRVPDPGGHPEQPAVLLHHVRPELQLHRGPGVRPAGGFQYPTASPVDGHRINDGIFDSATVGTEFILDVDLIDRVEVIRGPSSSLNGSNAFFGVINVITRRGKDLKGTEVSGRPPASGPSRGGPRTATGSGTGWRLLSGTAFRSEGQDLFFPEFNDPATNNGIAEKRDGDKFHSFFSTLAYRDFTFQAAYISREKTIPTGSYGTEFNDPRNRTVDDRYYADLRYDHGIDEKTSIAARVFYDWYGYRGDYVFSDNAINPVPPSRYVNKDDTRNGWWGGEVKLTRRMLETHRLTVGAEYRDYFRQDQRNFDENPFTSRLDDEEEHHGLGDLPPGRIRDRKGVDPERRGSPRSVLDLRRDHQPRVAPLEPASEDDAQALFTGKGVPRPERVRNVLHGRRGYPESEPGPPSREDRDHRGRHRAVDRGSPPPSRRRLLLQDYGPDHPGNRPCRRPPGVSQRGPRPGPRGGDGIERPLGKRSGRTGQAIPTRRPRMDSTIAWSIRHGTWPSST